MLMESLLQLLKLQLPKMHCGLSYALWPASGGHTATGTTCDGLGRFLFCHRSVMLLGYAHPDKSEKVFYISSVQIETQPFAIS